MGNSLPTPVLGAITPNVPYVLTDQVANSPPKQQHERAVTMMANIDEKTVYYAVVIAAVIYFGKRLRG
jgi:hypothetical protein